MFPLVIRIILLKRFIRSPNTLAARCLPLAEKRLDWCLNRQGGSKNLDGALYRFLLVVLLVRLAFSMVAGMEYQGQVEQPRFQGPTEAWLESSGIKTLTT